MFKKNHGIFAFVDVENMRNAALDAGYKDFDYEKLYNWLFTKKGVTRIYLYVPIEKGDTQKEQYYSGLRKLPNCYVDIKEVMLYPQKMKVKNITCPKCQHQHFVQVSQNNKRKGNCDAELTLDVIRFGVRKKYDTAIIFSGDGDFAKVYEYVHTGLNRSVIVYGPAGVRTSKKVKQLSSSKVITLESATGLLQHCGQR